MKTEQYSGEQLRQWRHRLGVPLHLVARLGRLSMTAVSYIERGAVNPEAAKKVVNALQDIETVIERRPINLEPRSIERGVAELRKNRAPRKSVRREAPVTETATAAFAR